MSVGLPLGGKGGTRRPRLSRREWVGRFAFQQHPPTNPLRDEVFRMARSNAGHPGEGARLLSLTHHLDAFTSARAYDTATTGLDPDLMGPPGPIEPVLARLDDLLATPIELTDEQFADLVSFVRYGLLDPRASPDRLRRLVPAEVQEGTNDDRVMAWAVACEMYRQYGEHPHRHKPRRAKRKSRELHPAEMTAAQLARFDRERYGL